MFSHFFFILTSVFFIFLVFFFYIFLLLIFSVLPKLSLSFLLSSQTFAHFFHLSDFLLFQLFLCHPLFITFTIVAVLFFLYIPFKMWAIINLHNVLSSVALRNFNPLPPIFVPFLSSIQTHCWWQIVFHCFSVFHYLLWVLLA